MRVLLASSSRRALLVLESSKRGEPGRAGHGKGASPAEMESRKRIPETSRAGARKERGERRRLPAKPVASTKGAKKHKIEIWDPGTRRRLIWRAWRVREAQLPC